MAQAEGKLPDTQQDTQNLNSGDKADGQKPQNAAIHFYPCQKQRQQYSNSNTVTVLPNTLIR